MPISSPSRAWPIVAVIAAALATVLAAVALIVALTRTASATSSEPTSTAATYSSTEIEEASNAVCYAWTLGAEAIERATTSPAEDADLATARVNARGAMMNAAGLLDAAMADVPAAKEDVKAGARTLSYAYQARVAIGVIGGEDPREASMDREVESADARMAEVCGGG